MSKSNSMIQEKEYVSFLSFDHDLKLKWSVSIPHNVAEDFILEKVHLFLASVSISSAVFKPYYVDPFADSGSDGTKETSRATYVNCEDNTMIVAKQIEQGSNEWHGFIVNPSYIVSEQVILPMIDAFEQAAEYLVGKVADKRMQFLNLSESVRRLYGSDNWWREKSLFLHLRDGLINLGNCHFKEVEACSNEEKPETHTRLSSTGALTKLKSVLFRWHPCVPSIWVASSSNERVYYDNMTIGETKILSWYHDSVYSIGNRERRQYYVEIAPDETVRLWFRHRDWLTIIQFTTDKSFSLTMPRAVHRAANGLMDEVTKSQR
ncbi:hypothetical protein FGB62_92g028 [Gracilaria domingensis]|nr:hypothetical protein FGB62_92g028 [Gracilaria domingensis]